MEPYQVESILKGLSSLLFLFLALVAILNGIAVYQNARANRLLKSIDRSLKKLPAVERTLRRAG